MFIGRGKPKGFTLIELLVVISIIALLMAILIPALQRVKKQAMTVACRSNLHPLSLVALAYARQRRALLAWLGGRGDYGVEVVSGIGADV